MWRMSSPETEGQFLPVFGSGRGINLRPHSVIDKCRVRMSVVSFFIPSKIILNSTSA